MVMVIGKLFLLLPAIHLQHPGALPMEFIRGNGNGWLDPASALTLEYQSTENIQKPNSAFHYSDFMGFAESAARPRLVPSRNYRWHPEPMAASSHSLRSFWIREFLENILLAGGQSASATPYPTLS